MKTLMVFDFDHTVVDDNSDTWVIRCLPGGTLPDSLRNSYRKGHWTEFMGRVLKHIGEQNVTPDQIRSVLETIPFTDGMKELLTYISQHKNSIDCIVISDSNTLFIEWILQASGLQSAVDHVFTNPADINEQGYMEVRGYHTHNCTKCPVNICKKEVLALYLSQHSERGVEYEKVFYVGDGGNDLCPTACLREQDVVMPRKGYSLEKHLIQLENQTGSIRPRVMAWSSGNEILQELKATV
ncbi:pyridoxal phosphate phosphatase PHOSPHO2 [Periophthalmus magnuspinnatus]|uniref:pyridoxal phosphate phosphatase PHOSPHO2 n=1 Tax=Periophthalmus magnuspinnatus TaxID=409849 RepID=UPI00145AA62A|nr:pyridoxal phosphate phosphatase PHOSPHO2 [Periophthalmus magnuspinnatus]